jgi:hypothetical protein
MSLLARLDAALLARHARACPWPTTSGAVTTKGATMARDERAGVASETEGEKGTELRPCDSVAPESPTGEDVANLMERQLAVLRERDAARVELTDLRTRLAERDASIVRLTKTIAKMRTGRSS